MYKLLITLVLFLSPSAIFAQTFNASPAESEMIIYGTSNVHDWEVDAEEFNGNAEIILEEDSLVSITDLQFNVMVEGIKSGKGGMDKKMYGALNPKKYSTITFVLAEVVEMTDSTLLANGELTISGVTNEIQMEVVYEILEDGSLSFKGSHPITMSDYDVDPPKAMFGAIKAGDDVTVTFDTKFVQQSL